MKTILLTAAFSIIFFTNCSKEPVALNEYHPQNITKISGVSAEVSEQDLIEAKKIREVYLKNGDLK
jgi:PBP1b-binding outer membrane lipoprotein LpoB